MLGNRKGPLFSCFAFRLNLTGCSWKQAARLGWIGSARFLAHLHLSNMVVKDRAPINRSRLPLFTYAGDKKREKPIIMFSGEEEGDRSSY